MDPILAAARALVARFKETTAVHDEVAALETALDSHVPAPAPLPPPPVANP